MARLWGLSFSGFIAWVIWVGLHIYRLVGFRNRLVVMVNWAWDYVFYENQVRLDHARLGWRRLTSGAASSL